MLFYVLNQQFQTIDTIDQFESAIWTDRFATAGDFELVCFPDKHILESCQIDNYLYNPDSEHLMFIENRETKTDTEDGPRFIVTGRSLEAMLSRRIVWEQTTLAGSFQNGIKKILEDAFISPKVESRKVSNFVFKESTDPRILKMETDVQYLGDNVYDVVINQCSDHKVGFKITLDFTTLAFVFELYMGVDRTYEQTENPYVVFSPNFDNIVNSQFYESAEEYKNVALVSGEGDEGAKKFVTTGTTEGLLRRELYVDANDIRKEKDDGTTMTDAEYEKALIQKGKRELSEAEQKTTFDGEVDSTNGFVYGVDFFIGDLVQVVNEYEMSGASLISEIIWSQDDDGFKCYPSFVAQNNKDTLESGGVPDLKLGHALEYDSENRLSVIVTDEAEPSNTFPISSRGVSLLVGNINSLLENYLRREEEDETK